MRRRVESTKAADPELVSLAAELLARRIGEAVLTCILVLAQITSLTVMGLLVAFIYKGQWIALPVAKLETLFGRMAGSWTEEATRFEERLAFKSL